MIVSRCCADKVIVVEVENGDAFYQCDCCKMPADIYCSLNFNVSHRTILRKNHATI